MGTTPCVEVMVPVLSRQVQACCCLSCGGALALTARLLVQAWRCVWAMLPNDLVHAFGLDLAWHVCATGNGSVRDSIAIVDEVFIEHLGSPTLGEQGQADVQGGQPAWCARLCRPRVSVQLDLPLLRI
jgi:hypothetical protein